MPIGEHQVRRQIYVGIVHSATTIHNPYVTGVLMTMAAIFSDAVHHAQCSMLKASPDASGRPCRASVCDVSMLCVDQQWPTKH